MWHEYCKVNERAQYAKNKLDDSEEERTMRHRRIIMMGVFLFSIVFAMAFVRTGETETASTEGSGTIQGKVIFEGTPPTPELLKRDADPFCAKTPMKD